MNNIRQIIEERLDNARNDWLLDKRDYLRGQMVSYRDCLNLLPEDIGELSDGYHTFNSLYEQRMYLFATLVNLNSHKSWKSYKHEDGQLCFGGGWFIVGIDTPKGTYTYHYENKYWYLFECQELETAKHWDGHTDKDIARVLSLTDPRTEADILKDFEKLGWKVADDYTNLTLKKKITCNDEKFMWSWICYISIDKENKTYRVFKNGHFSTDSYEINMQEHKLLNELFEVWGW
jgi:hypothetical protein